MKIGPQASKWLDKKSRQGFHGYPIGSVAFFGPDDRRATKATAAITVGPDQNPVRLHRWTVEDGDIRRDPAVLDQIVTFLKAHTVRTVTAEKSILGCPHEPGIDRPAGAPCPHCPFWADRAAAG